MLVIDQTGKKNKRFAMKYVLTATVAISAIFMTGCSKKKLLYVPPTMNESKIQIEEKTFSDDVLVDDVDVGYINAVASHYQKYGDGPMEVLITYDPKSYRNTAMFANNKAAEIKKALQQNGVTTVVPDVLPIHALGDHARLIISYSYQTAQTSLDCETQMPGLTGRSLDYNEDYKIGCGTQSLIAQQISKPKDLLGQGNVSSTTDGRAASNIVDAYRSGALNKPLDGESASGE